MWTRLKKHWKVETKDLILILSTFAVTGTLTAWLSKKVAEWLLLEPYGFGWWTSKILILIFGYQVIILVVGFCFGMFPFFWKYEKKILSRFGFIKKNKSGEAEESFKYSIAIFASGAGSNAQNIITYFKNNSTVNIALIVCSNSNAGVLSIASREAIPILLLENKKFLETGYVPELKEQGIDFILLAGFLWKVPVMLINAFKQRIINIHPALLPAYGGKGMYGNAVHTSVVAAKEKESGITIHYVDEIYDHGKIIFQTRCTLDENETAETLAKKIHALEYEYYPKKIEEVLVNLERVSRV